jgi:hypothetical protein
LQTIRTDTLRRISNEDDDHGPTHPRHPYPPGSGDFFFVRSAPVPTVISPEEARAKEDEINENLAGFENDWPRDPESAAKMIYGYLYAVGVFMRNGDDALFFFRNATGTFYPVTGPRRRRFTRYVAMLCRLDSRKPATKEAIEHLAEHIRHHIRRMFVTLEGVEPSEWQKPLRLAAKKRKIAGPRRRASVHRKRS